VLHNGQSATKAGSPLPEGGPPPPGGPTSPSTGVPLISAGHRTVSALSMVGAVLLVVFAITIRGVLQEWYQKVFDQPSPLAAGSPSCGS
jgi:hypothetical protein